MVGIATNIIRITVPDAVTFISRADGYIGERFAFADDIHTGIWAPILLEGEDSA